MVLVFALAFVVFSHSVRSYSGDEAEALVLSHSALVREAAQGYLDSTQVNLKSYGKRKIV